MCYVWTRDAQMDNLPYEYQYTDKYKNIQKKYPDTNMAFLVE